MAASVQPEQWKREETGGNHRAIQRDFGGVVVVGEPHRLANHLIARASFSGCLHECVRNDGRTDDEIAKAISISKSYMSKFLRGVGESWAKRLVRFMRETNCIAPLQWMADQMGCDVVERDSRAAEVAALRARLADLEKAA